MNLDSFLKKEPEERQYLIHELTSLIVELDKKPGVGFSKITKILHTRYPEIIPMIDVPLQKKYKELKREKWKEGDWQQLLLDYYNNFRKKETFSETFSNLSKVYDNLPSLNLTKIRIFDILWWSYLKSRKNQMGWKTIKQLK